MYIVQPWAEKPWFLRILQGKSARQTYVIIAVLMAAVYKIFILKRGQSLSRKIRIVTMLLGGLILLSTASGLAASKNEPQTSGTTTALYGMTSIDMNTLKTENDNSAAKAKSAEPVQAQEPADFVLANIEPESFESTYSPGIQPDEAYTQGQTMTDSTLREKTLEELDHEIHNPENVYLYSDKEKAYIARVVYAEARGEKFEGQVAVASVVLNRFESGRFGSSVKRVVLARSQFAVSKKYSDQAFAAVEEAIANRNLFPEDMYYFQASKNKHWRNFEYYVRIGGHSFYCAAN